MVYKCDVTNQWDADGTGNVPSMVWYHIYGVVASSCIYGVIAKTIGTKTKWMNPDGYFFQWVTFRCFGVIPLPRAARDIPKTVSGWLENEKFKLIENVFAWVKLKVGYHT